MDRIELAELWAHVAELCLKKKDYDGAMRAVEAYENLIFTHRLPQVWRQRTNRRREADAIMERLTGVTS